MACLPTVLVLCLAGTASAQAPLPAPPAPADVAAGNALFEKGLRLLKATSYVEASRAFEQSQKLNPQWGTLFNLAQCYRLSGKLASAWAAYRDVAQHDTNPAKRDRRNEADRRARELEHRLSRLLLTSNGPPDGLVITLDGVDVTARLGTDNPVDTGEHKLHASAPSYGDFDSTVTISGEGQTATVSIELTPFDNAPSVVMGPTSGGAIAPEGTPIMPSPGGARPEGSGTTGRPGEAAEPTPHSRRRTYGMIVAAGGGALVVTGLVFGQLASSKWSEAQGHCPDHTCSNADMLNGGLVRDARSRADISTALVISGAAAVGIGAVLFITAPSRAAHATSTALRLTPSASADAVSLTLDGRF